MNNSRLFLDTAFVQALIDQRDQYNSQAQKHEYLLIHAALIIVTEVVLAEIGDALSSIDREAASRFIERCYISKNIIVLTVDTALFRRGLLLYRNRPDKTWGLTDCISFVVMQEQGLTDALTSDRHFVQAGYRALLLENNS